MKIFKGIPHNIDRPILGTIVRSNYGKWLGNRSKPYIAILHKSQKHLPKADAYILSETPTKAMLPNSSFIEGVSMGDTFNIRDGDIVSLSNEGYIRILYSIDSSHNTIFTTNQCNLKCIMCPQPPQKGTDDHLDYNLSLIKMMNPNRTPYLAITGGEPTLLGEGFFTLIDSCKKRLPKTSLLVLSNGKRFKELEFAKKLATIQHPALTIAVPLYSDNELIHDKIVGVIGSFNETIKGIYNLALLRQRIEIRTVIHALNYERLPNFANFLYHNLPFSNHVALMGMEIMGLARNNISKLWIDPFIYSTYLEKAIIYFRNVNMNVSIYNHQLCIIPKRLWIYCVKSISSWKNSYKDECNKCTKKEECGGFFETSGNYYSEFIRSIT